MNHNKPQETIYKFDKEKSPIRAGQAAKRFFPISYSTAEVWFLAGLDDPVDGLRVGIVPALWQQAGMTEEVRLGLFAARSALEDQGVAFVEVEMPNMDAAIATY